MNKAKAKDKIYMGCQCYESLQPNTKHFVCDLWSKHRRALQLLILFFYPFLTFVLAK
jgi:hypothetical protein